MRNIITILVLFFSVSVFSQVYWEPHAHLRAGMVLESDGLISSKLDAFYGMKFGENENAILGVELTLNNNLFNKDNQVGNCSICVESKPLLIQDFFKGKYEFGRSGIKAVLYIEGTLRSAILNSRDMIALTGLNKNLSNDGEVKGEIDLMVGYRLLSKINRKFEKSGLMVQVAFTYNLPVFRFRADVPDVDPPF